MRLRIAKGKSSTDNVHNASILPTVENDREDKFKIIILSIGERRSRYTMTKMI